MLLENFKTLLRNKGFRHKQTIPQVREIIQKEFDKIREFIEECLVKNPNGITSKTKLYEIYQKYSEDQNHEIFSKPKLGARLPTYGFKDHQKKGLGRCWLGYSINKDSEWIKNHIQGVNEWF